MVGVVDFLYGEGVQAPIGVIDYISTTYELEDSIPEIRDPALGWRRISDLATFVDDHNEEEEEVSVVVLTRGQYRVAEISWSIELSIHASDTTYKPKKHSQCEKRYNIART